jgi:Ca2+-binding RTX toxin-like protein
MGNPRRKRPTSQNQSLNFDHLEKRCLLAALIDFDPTTQIVTIDGTDGEDQIWVNYVGGYDNIRIAAIGGDSANRLQLPTSQIAEIHFQAKDGDDLFRNNTHRQSFVDGGLGNDLLVGGWVDDVLNGNDGNDHIVGRFGSDILNGDSGNDILRGGHDNDIIMGSEGDDRVIGGSGTNTIDAGSGSDIVFGGSGPDTIDGSDGNDFIYAGSGDDVVDGGEGQDVIRGGAGIDELDGGSENDRVVGDQGDDVLSGSAGNDLLFGDDGDDEISGGEGADLLLGGTGDDLLIGDDGDDTLYGESGVDVLKGRDGNDGLFGGLGETDELQGGKGADRLLSMVDEDDDLEELVFGWNSEDAIVRFEDLPNYTIEISGIGNVTFTAQAWTEAEIRTIDVSLEALHQKVGSTALLKTHQGVSLRFQRAGDLVRQAFLIGGWNQGGNIGLTNDAFRTELRAQAVTYHEVGHNWDQSHENPLYSQFESISMWRNSYASGYTLSSGGGNWHYLDSASDFARDYSRWNPYEDYATTWETYFTSQSHGSNGWTGNDTIVPEKFANLDAFFAQLT